MGADPLPDQENSGRRLRLGLEAAALVFFLLPIGSAVRLIPTTPSPPLPTAPPVNLLLTLGKRTFQDALRAQGLHESLIVNLVKAFRPHLNFHRLRPSDSLEVQHDGQGAVSRVVYRQSPLDIVEATRGGGGWTAARRLVPVEQRVLLVAGTLRGNLFDSIEALGEQGQLVLDFAEIFAWDVDFASDSQPGDRFRMLVEKVYTGDQFVRYGRILVAEYETGGRVHTGIYFRDNGTAGYYTPAGESLRRAFLKSPLEFTRISSGFSRARRHPILGGVRPHLAVDYAAPLGTPVWAVADGVVEAAGWRGGNGNTVVICHRANFKTMYNHLSGFGKGIRPGVAVRQRSVIGYVGATGLATGPHLDYRVIKDGAFVNPLKQTFLPGAPISSAARAAFLEQRQALLGQLRDAVASQSGEARPRVAAR